MRIGFQKAGTDIRCQSLSSVCMEIALALSFSWYSGMKSQFPSNDNSVRLSVSLSSLTAVYCARSLRRFSSFSCVESAMRYSCTLTPFRASSANGMTVRSSNSVSIHPPPNAPSPVGERLLFLSSKSMWGSFSSFTKTRIRFPHTSTFTLYHSPGTGWKPSGRTPKNSSVPIYPVRIK